MNPRLVSRARLLPGLTAAALTAFCALAAFNASAKTTPAAVPVHTHGQALVNVAVQGPQLSVFLELPLDSLVGFEHRPRTDAQRQAAQAALQQLKDANSWLKPDAAAGCTLARSEINADALAPAPAAKPGPAQPEPTHADVDASWEFTCAAPDKLAGLDLALMTVFKRIQRLDVQVVAAKGQHKLTLRRPATRVVLKK